MTRKVAGRRSTTVRPRKAEAESDDAGRDAEELNMDDLSDLLGFLIRRAQIWVFQDFAKSLSHLNIRPAEYAVLSMVEANPGMIQMTLSNALGIERAHLARLLHRLEDRMLVNRIPSVSDRRSHSLHITPRGRDLLRRSRAVIAQQEMRLAEKLGPDRYEEIKKAFTVFAAG